jgi:hypothetical protein
MAAMESALPRSAIVQSAMPARPSTWGRHMRASVSGPGRRRSGMVLLRGAHENLQWWISATACAPFVRIAGTHRQPGSGGYFMLWARCVGAAPHRLCDPAQALGMNSLSS